MRSRAWPSSFTWTRIVLHPFAHLFGEPAAPAGGGRGARRDDGPPGRGGARRSTARPSAWFTRWDLQAKGASPVTRRSADRERLRAVSRAAQRAQSREADHGEDRASGPARDTVARRGRHARRPGPPLSPGAARVAGWRAPARPADQPQPSALWPAVLLMLVAVAAVARPGCGRAIDPARQHLRLAPHRDRADRSSPGVGSVALVLPALHPRRRGSCATPLGPSASC